MRYQKGGAFLESIQRYWKRTDKVYLLLCLFSSGMAVLALASWAAKQGNGFAVDGLTGQITGVGDYRRAMVQAGAAAIGIVVCLIVEARSAFVKRSAPILQSCHNRPSCAPSLPAV